MHTPRLGRTRLHDRDTPPPPVRRPSQYYRQTNTTDCVILPLESQPYPQLVQSKNAYRAKYASAWDEVQRQPTVSKTRGGHTHNGMVADSETFLRAISVDTRTARRLLSPRGRKNQPRKSLPQGYVRSCVLEGGAAVCVSSLGGLSGVRSGSARDPPTSSRGLPQPIASQW